MPRPKRPVILRKDDACLRFDSITEAANYLGVKRPCVSQVLKQRCRHYKIQGFTAEYDSDYVPPKPPKQNTMKRSKTSGFYEPGSIIKQKLEEKGMKQVELADITNLLPPIINDIISGKRAMTPNITIRICLALGLDPFEIGRAYSDFAIKEELTKFMIHINKNEYQSTI